MKRLIVTFILILMLFVFAGCGSISSQNRTVNSQTTVDDVLQSAALQSDTSKSDINTVYEDMDKSENVISAENVDVDLTALSSTMVYSEVYNMMSMPDDYIGKTVKMSGIFSAIHDDTTGKDYYACIIQDATACCAQGIEFILTDDSTYPEEGEIISVVGIFDTYNEGQFRYSTLRDAIIV